MEATPGEGKRPPRNETAASLPSLSRRARARADARRASATTASAISSADALPTDELCPPAVADIPIAGGIERRTTPESACCCRGRGRGLGWWVLTWGTAASEAASLLACLEGSTWAGANTCREGATTAGAVGVGETLTGDELSASAIAHVRSARGVEGWLCNSGGSEGDEGGNGDKDGLHCGDS